jgi:hypothetical protein
MNNNQAEQAAILLKGNTKRALMQKKRVHTQKQIISRKALMKLRELRITSLGSPELIENAILALDVAADELDEAFDDYNQAIHEAYLAGWSDEDIKFFTKEVEEQVMAADAAGGNGGRVQGGGRRTRKRSSRRKSSTRKTKQKH